MTDPRFPNFKYPEGRSPLLVRVFNLTASSEEQVVKDFFRFCGKIDDFAMIKTEDGKSAEALICFEKEGAAKTALMLTNATIGDRMIKVEPYYKDEVTEASTSEAKPTTESTRSTESNETSANGQTAFTTSNYLSTLWTTGLQISQTVLQGAKALDSTFGISAQAAAYMEKAKEETIKLDQKYQVTERATEFDSKLGIREKLTQAVSTATVLGKQALETEQGKKVHGYYEKAISTAAELKEEAIRAINLDTNAPPSHSTDRQATSKDPVSTPASEETSSSSKTPENPPSTESSKPCEAN